MTRRLPTLTAAALFALGVAPFGNAASAMPVDNAVVSQSPARAGIETAQWRGGWHGGGGRFGAGLLGGALLGGMLAAPYYYGPYYAYPAPYYPGTYYPPRYYAAPAQVAAPTGDAIAYCARRFKSYDPSSGTYLGYDRHRHPCP